METADLVVIGGGIVGLATAERFTRARSGARDGSRVVVLEKERELAAHQTGRNSGVVHSGIYYKPGSQKAALCRAGKRALEEFCAEHGVRHERCGKVVVAVDASEVPRLDKIEERARANGVACERIGPQRLRELEPHAAGVAALHVPETGIVDYVGVCAVLAELVRARGGAVETGARVAAIRTDGDAVVVTSTRGEWRARRLVNCAGLHSDRVAELAGTRRAARIVPFRGEYYELAPDARALVRNLIYPVPDPAFPFLGVHFTRMVGGGVECGPNAVLALAREGYRWSDVAPADVWDALTYRGFRRFAARHWRMGLAEVHRSLSKRAFVRALQRLLPAIRAEQLVPAAAGVRAQALLDSGELVDDFLIQSNARCVHVLNAPSPAATASLAIGAAIVDALN
ncbi:MAG: L-2-hydroxyglutarate oxidase [Planctomycetota bacterium]|nr:MAG: L-2-hydroxyglutarate oxidase [Planctomycetota bacterium]